MGELALGIVMIVCSGGLLWLLVDGLRTRSIIPFWSKKNHPEIGWHDRPVYFVITMLSWLVFSMPFFIGAPFVVVKVWVPLWSIPIAVVGPLVGAFRVWSARGITPVPTDIEYVLDHAARGQREEAQGHLAAMGDSPSKAALAAIVDVAGGASTADYRSPAVVTTKELLASFEIAVTHQVQRANVRFLPALGVLALAVFLFSDAPRADRQGIAIACVVAAVTFGLSLFVRHRALASLRATRRQAIARLAAG